MIVKCRQCTRVFCAINIYQGVRQRANKIMILKISSVYLIVLLQCLACAAANNLTRRDGNTLSCGFYKKFNWKRFLWLDFKCQVPSFLVSPICSNNIYRAWRCKAFSRKKNYGGGDDGPLSF